MRQVEPGESYPFKRIVIVGGGTAGWLAALMCKELLAHYVNESGAHAPEVVVVESSNIPTIGVGEGTTAVFASVLGNLGIDETEFLKETGATIKFGIKHRDWTRPGTSYDGPIDNPLQVLSYPQSGPWLDLSVTANGKPGCQHHLFHYLLNLNKAHVAVNSTESRKVHMGPFQHAYHFDQAKVGAFLQKKTKNVERIDALIEDCVLDNESQIQYLITESGEKIHGDFFIDCSGFRRQLIRQMPGFGWESFQDALPVNRAMPFWLPLDESGSVPPYTLAWAQANGWLWQIPTTERMGCGYVYCDKYATPETAQREIEAVLGHKIEPRADIRFDSGRLKQAWIKNCLALGLSSSFLEPLEATSIHATVVQLMLLLNHHIGVQASDEHHTLCFLQPEKFNQTVELQLDNFKEFVNLHYAGDRQDSEFWRAINAEHLTEYNKERINRWQSEWPMPEDFPSLTHNLPHLEAPLYYPVLHGLGMLNRQSAKQRLSKHPGIRKQARKDVEVLSREYRIASAQAMDHGDYLRSLH